MREFKKIEINKKAELSVRAGHPWVYAEEVTGREDGIENGEIVDVLSQKRRYLGSGFYNDNSKILVRIISSNANDTFDRAFFKRRIAYAVNYRRVIMGAGGPCRLIYGDSDGMPGLIADLFGSVVVTEITSLGMEVRKDMIFGCLLEVLSEAGIEVSLIYERNDVKVRAKEGLKLYKGPSAVTGQYSGDGTVRIEENGVKYDVDFINGQKTGYFLDQKYNRALAARIAEGKTVLDCFTHVGCFALNCRRAGAAKVTAVDISEEAIKTSRHNAEINGFDDIDFVCSDVFDFLDALEASGKREYDYIILDPPAFTKSSSTVKTAYAGYRDINYKAMKLLPRGGWLATCSCSHFMTDALFRQMLNEAAAQAGVGLKLASYSQQAPDHPVLMSVPETEYLKFYILQIV